MYKARDVYVEGFFYRQRRGIKLFIRVYKIKIFCRTCQLQLVGDPLGLEEDVARLALVEHEQAGHVKQAGQRHAAAAIAARVAL